jgi:hypothetical protein
VFLQGCGAPYVTQGGPSSSALLNTSRELDLVDLSRQSLLEIEECRPFITGVIGQSYGWIPTSLPLWLGLPFPWLHSFQNPHIPNDRGVELEFTDKRRSSVDSDGGDALVKRRSVFLNAAANSAYAAMSRDQRIAVNLFGRVSGTTTAGNAEQSQVPCAL